VILCTGVCDIWPDIPNVLDYVGKSLFWCITCDGFRALDKRVLIFGSNDEAAVTTCQFHLYTRDLTFLSAPQTLVCSEDSLCSLREHKVRMIDGKVAEVLGTPEKLEGVVLTSGERIEADIMFSLLGATVNNRLALDLGVRCTPSGYVLVDEEGYTNVPGVFAAGDLSKAHTHQVVSAAHEGAEAAQTANYYLYADYQKHE
ncbi:MAG TPA: NAD(P)/FAD-dependent oxidoreductase, partial [Fimbriimonadaceae bacterium]|nr:NAD(P)/FAD-dependent oxidoreductase [Fimbriimonadaceae bacterium]